MATTSTQAACPPSPTNVVDATVPRKRRRRAPATGAADDCFACLDRKTKCDRRRPYCTQCLDQGKDCSGYKTTLTWGVGVASRGKLRGLTLPIVQKAAPAANPHRHRARSSISGVPGPRTPTQKFQGPCDGQAQYRMSASNPPTIPINYDFVSTAATTSSPVLHPVPSACPTWPVPSIPSRTGGSPKQKAGLRRRSLLPLNVPPASSYQNFGVSKSAPFFGGYDFPSYNSPVEYPHTPDDFAFIAGLLPYYKNFSSDQSIAINPNDCVPFSDHGPDVWPGGSLSSSLSSNHSSNDFFMGDLLQSENLGMSGPLAASLDVSSGEELSVRTTVKTEEEAEDVTTTPRPSPEDLNSMALSVGDVTSRIALSMSRSLPSLSIGKTPRLQYLVNYYDTAIAPFIVAFDGPFNPYRTHILQLAIESETLQHAIAALACSNLRTREYHNAISAHRASPAQIEYPSGGESPADGGVKTRTGSQNSGPITKSPSPEEIYHKRASVQSLNTQLADPLRMKDDCILATLLILCLYHVCDTGVAKFRIQFEGVKKILGMRSSGTKSGSNEPCWLATMFTWFDAMTATVNDREGQLQAAHLDMTAFSGNEWALENLAGCDGQLFRIIAKLGRLNMLSQGRQVEHRDPPRSHLMTCSRTASIPRQDYYSMNHNRFDGNGWASLLEDEELMTDQEDSHVQFWKEWSQIRTELQDWELESPATSDPLSTSTVSPNIDRGDLLHISESFRHSALIYTERLAHPHLRSLHPNFQNLVARAIYHMTSVKSDVFLLWPLFITGTECVDEHHRSLIRQRCLHIQKDSGFFNNISTLELLEKIWRDNKHGQQEGVKMELNANGTENTTACGQRFRWRKAMERPDGEYIVI